VTTGLLVVGHGSRLERAAEEADLLVGHLRERLGDVPVGVGWLENAEPYAVDAGLAMVREHGLVALVVQPLLLFSAYHATSDLPDVAAGIDAADPRVRVVTGRPLGVDARLLALAAQLVAGVDPEPASNHALLVVSSGTSDPDALAQAQVAARQLAALTGHPHVAHALATLSGGDIAVATATLAVAGASQVTAMSWSLLAGRLVNEAQRQVEEAAFDAGVRVAFAGRFGPDPVVADVLADRFHEALGT